LGLLMMKSEGADGRTKVDGKWGDRRMAGRGLGETEDVENEESTVLEREGKWGSLCA
jgi:hypothetical protein